METKAQDTGSWARLPGDPTVQMLLPRVYGSTPTIFGAPLAETLDDVASADLAFVGIPWRAPTPDSRMGRAASNFEGTLLTPSYFRINSLKYAGYLPEIDIDVFKQFRLVDRGDVEIVRDMARTLANVEEEIGGIIDRGCIPITIGGNSGPSSYSVLKQIAAKGGKTAVLNLDAHCDNQRGEWQEDDPRVPRWGSTWARQILTLPNVDPARYFHFGLRGPRNNAEAIGRFTECGVNREHIYTYRDLKAARRSGFEQWAEQLAAEVVDDAEKVWIGVDPDVLDLGVSPDWGDEPLGPSVDEIVELVYQVGRAAGRSRFGGISIMALPYDAQSFHAICIYILVYALAGVASAELAAKEA